VSATGNSGPAVPSLLPPAGVGPTNGNFKALIAMRWRSATSGALQLLVSSPFGASEAMMFANGFTRKTLVPLIRAGLATTQRENPIARGQSLGRVRITDAGRRALEDY
jgi:hypothetical protein